MFIGGVTERVVYGVVTIALLGLLSCTPAGHRQGLVGPTASAERNGTPRPAGPFVQVRIPEQIPVHTPNDYLEPGAIVSYDDHSLKIEGFADACFPPAMFQPKEGNVHSWRGRTVHANDFLFHLQTSAALSSAGFDFEKHRGSVASVEMSGAKQRLFSGAQIELAIRSAFFGPNEGGASDLCRTALRRGQAVVDSVYVAESATFYFHRTKVRKAKAGATGPTTEGDVDSHKSSESEHELSFDRPLVVGYTIRRYRPIYAEKKANPACQQGTEASCLLGVAFPQD